MSEGVSEVQTKVGVIAIIGAPNAGKSTLVNALVGAKVSIVTHKVQTTRFQIRGLMAIDETQLILIDTPGVFAPKRRLDRAMVRAAWAGAEDADEIVHLVDAASWAAFQAGEAKGAHKKNVADDERIIGQLKEANRQALLVLNKIDLIEKESLLAIIAELNERGVYSDIMMISALKGEGLEELKTAFVASAKPSPWLYPEDQMADLPVRLMAAEITRERLMLRLHQELPYQLGVETENWETLKDGSVRIEHLIRVAREAHRKMVLGKGGQVIKAIGSEARRDISDVLGQKVHLFLRVKLDPKWADTRQHYEEYGLDFNA